MTLTKNAKRTTGRTGHGTNPSAAVKGANRLGALSPQEPGVRSQEAGRRDPSSEPFEYLRTGPQGERRAGHDYG